MHDGEWSLAYGDVSQSFGYRDPSASTVIFHAAVPDVGDVPLTVDDAIRPRSDGVAFGADYRNGRTITFSLSIKAATESDAMLAESQLARAWRGDAIRTTAGALATLTAQNSGRQRIMYGRPRRYGPPDFSGRKAGLITVPCDFACVDDVFYAAQSSVRVTFVQPPSGGITVPTTLPVTTIPVSSQAGALTIGGDIRTWVVTTIHGPILNPTVKITNQWSLQLLTNIPAGSAITLDPRPWARSVTRDDGASFAGALTRTSRLATAYLEPGTYGAVLEGTDATGTAYMTLTWQAAHAGLSGDTLVAGTVTNTVVQETGGGDGGTIT